MKKILFLVFLFIIAQTVLSQSKYLIYFEDKGFDKSFRLDKSTAEYQQAVENLSFRSVQRRIKNMGENFITYEDLPVKEEYVNVVESFGIIITNRLSWFNAVSAYLHESQLSTILELPFVKTIEPVKTFKFRSKIPERNLFEKPLSVLEDFGYGNSFQQVSLSDVIVAHQKGITGEGVVIGLLDTGFDWMTHESLNNRNVIAEYDFVFDDSVTANEPEDVFSQHSHGTLVLSVLGGFKDSSLIGPSFNSSFVLAKTEDVRSETHVEEDNYAAALIWMESLGVDIATSSLGYNIFDNSSYSYEDMDGRTTIVTKAAELAFARGVLTITSAGNEGDDPWFYIIAPADGINTLAIGAVNSQNEIAGFSSRGPSFDGRIKPDLTAMGVSVYGAISSTVDQYGHFNGTSLAAPIASGVAGQLLSAHPHLTNVQLRNILLESAGNSENPNNEIGYGLISAKNAIEFPNLQFSEGEFILNKAFLEDGIDPGSIKLFYSADEINFVEEEMTAQNNYNFTAAFPFFADGQEINFYITYKDGSSNTIRVPETKNFLFLYGDLDISLNLPLPVVNNDFVISDVYPNPFIPAQNRTVRIDINSSAESVFEAAIIDGAGQRVKQYKLTTRPGRNFIEWDGYSEHGYLCASGVYYFLIRFEGEEYGRKMILLK